MLATFKCLSVEDETDGISPAINNPPPTYSVLTFWNSEGLSKFLLLII
jgi:hypothetical protein